MSAAPSTRIRFQKCPFQFLQAKTRQNIFIHTSVFVSFSPIHSKALENDENDWNLRLRMC